MDTSKIASRGVPLLFWWFMIVSQHPGGTMTAATQGPFATQAQCDWGRQQIGVTGQQHLEFAFDVHHHQHVELVAARHAAHAADPVVERNHAAAERDAVAAGVDRLLPGDENERHGTEMRVGRPGGEVERPRPERAQADPGLAAEPPMAGLAFGR